MAGRKRGSTRRKVIWGAVAYLVTTLGTLLTDYLTRLHISPLLGSVLATAVGLVLVVVGVLIDAAKEGEAQGAPATAGYPQPYYEPYRPDQSGQRGGDAQTYQGGTYLPASRPGRRSAAGVAGVLALVLLFCGGGGFAIAYGAQSLGQRAIGWLDEQAKPGWEKKTEDPGRERLARAASRTEGALSVTVTSVRVNTEVTMVTITAKNSGTDSLNLPVFNNAQLGAAGASTLDADPAAGSFSGTVAAKGQATGTIVFDGALPAGTTRATLSFAHVQGSLKGPDSISVDIALTAS
ncbi:hypothetical protein Dvina_38700 [Dactylosporangium vinaceum]|uniref:DUF4352 domain-containing protein n=1 Tax=Dactylosporangium vinaceum TaxID=53362 RepID=A0ABV5MLA4_9ACTN|nr:DUF4352 domain-containing protein [Dactylosporangium vinaceum]UAB94075.1 hypothetical protein Dvina_38700 [Dactylosporangium vinaceum]